MCGLISRMWRDEIGRSWGSSGEVMDYRELTLKTPNQYRIKPMDDQKPMPKPEDPQSPKVGSDLSAASCSAPETEAMLLRIDDSEIDLSIVKSEMGDMEIARNRAEDALSCLLYTSPSPRD